MSLIMFAMALIAYMLVLRFKQRTAASNGFQPLRGREGRKVDSLEKEDALDKVAADILLFAGSCVAAPTSSATERPSHAMGSALPMRNLRQERQEAAFRALRDEKLREANKPETACFPHVSSTARQSMDRIALLNPVADRWQQDLGRLRVKAAPERDQGFSTEEKGMTTPPTKRRPSTPISQQLPTPQQLPAPQTLPRPRTAPGPKDEDDPSLGLGEVGIIERRKIRAEAIKEARRKQKAEAERRDLERQRRMQEQDSPVLSQRSLSVRVLRKQRAEPAICDSSTRPASRGATDRRPSHDEVQLDQQHHEEPRRSSPVRNADWIDPFIPYRFS